jgi:Na+/H+-dicarboxylate symporter
VFPGVTRVFERSYFCCTIQFFQQSINLFLLGLIVGSTFTGITDGNRLPVACRSVFRGVILTVTESQKSPVTEFITDS